MRLSEGFVKSRNYDLNKPRLLCGRIFDTILATNHDKDYYVYGYKSLEEMQIPLPDMARQRDIGAAFKTRFDRLKAAKMECERLLREMRSVCQGAF